MLGAVAEAIERYCAAHCAPDSLTYARYIDIKDCAIDPRDFVLYSASQYSQPCFPYRPFDDNTPTLWAMATLLPDTSSTLVPASLIYLPQCGDLGIEPLCQVTSNGLAAGTSLDAAILAGLLELIERDAFVVAWMNRLPGRHIPMTGVDSIASDIIRHYEAFGITVSLIDLTLDTPAHTVIAIATDKSGIGPAAAVGFGSSFDIALAVRRALFEVCQIRPGLTAGIRQRGSGLLTESPEDVRELTDHSRLFASLHMLDQLGFWLDDGKRRPSSSLLNTFSGDVATDLRRCVAALEERGVKVAYIDLTTPDIAPLGLSVVRVLATELQPIHFGYMSERLGGRRLYYLAQELGLVETPATEATINRCPHPSA
jgi:ribosomal protein S12 methylthiotransferase accessory factor